MRIADRLAAVVALGTITASAPAQAIQQPARLRGLPPLEVAAGPAARAQRAIAWGRAPQRASAWRRFAAEVGAGWRGAWDADTGVPSRLFGPGVPAPGASAEPARAEAFARAFLARHLDLLAPGASPADFVLASNDLDAGLRTVGFFQQHRGLRVLGGQVSFRFRNDRLFLIGSEALPRVDAAPPSARLDPAVARARATAWVLGDRAGAAQAGAVEGPFVLPLVRAGGADSRAVLRVTVDARRPIGRWSVYLDAATGAPVAREQTLRFADGALRLAAPVRYPLSDYSNYPAQRADLTVGGAPVTSDDAGLVSWADPAPVQLDAKLSGPLVRVLNDTGPAAAATFTLAPGGTALWSAPDEEVLDAQLSAFVHTQIVKAHAKKLAPEMAWLDTQISAVTNIDDICNAYSDGDNIHFFRADSECENTARLADVVYHEFGHSFHAHAIIPGVGYFEGGLSEGQSDYLAATLTGDPGTGRGFFFSDEPLRHIDPPDKEHAWPEDVSEIHETGRIISGALWDLRKALIAKLGPDEGVARTDQLYYQGIRRAVDIPSMYPELLAADDDDGDLTNGTPNVCEIAAAFGLHGIRGLSGELGELGVEPPTADGYRVSLRVEGLFAACPGDAIASASVAWQVRGEPQRRGDVAMIAGPGGLEATIPAQAAGEVVQYRVALTLGSGVTIGFPDNPADPLYELFVGETIPLYCTGFETDPGADGWTYSPGDWQWDAPVGSTASGDPAEASSGERVFGTELGHAGGDGNYTPDDVSSALSPVIQTGGHRHVRLQYRRWLNVEDGQFDQATIYADGQPVWQNLDSESGDFSSTHHRDKEWRFHDVDLSPFVADGAVQITYEIRSDLGLELGGWTLDELCVVAVSSCGNGALDAGEACDDGALNSDTAADACRSDCQPARCGDGVVDAAETCDAAEGCDATCGASSGGPTIPDDGCGCRAAGGPSPGGAVATALGLAALAVARTRRRPRR